MITKNIFPLLLLWAMILLSIYSKQSLANSIGVSYGQQDYQVSLPNTTLTLQPMGSAVSLSFDLSENWLLDLDYQQWQDNQAGQNQFDLALDIQSYAGSINYYLSHWYFSVSYSRSTVDTNFSSSQRQSNSFAENITSSSFGGSVGYGVSKGSWFYSALVSSLYSEWDFDKRELIFDLEAEPDALPRLRTEVSTGDASSLSGSLSLAHLWPLTPQRSFLVGTMFAWHYLLSGDAVLISRNGRNLTNIGQDATGRISNTAGLNSISGDASYGQFSLYASYDLSSSWSIDLDGSINIASDYSAPTWSISLAYLF